MKSYNDFTQNEKVIVEYIWIDNALVISFKYYKIYKKPK